MPIYHTLGQHPAQAAHGLPQPDGGLYAEELMGHEGFIGTSSLLYHTHPPTTVMSRATVRDVEWEADDDTIAAPSALPHRRARTRAGSPTLDRIAAAVQRGRRDAVRRARRDRRALLPQLAGGRSGVRRRRGGRARVGVRRPAVSSRATTWSSIATSRIAGGSMRRRAARSCW